MSLALSLNIKESKIEGPRKFEFFIFRGKNCVHDTFGASWKGALVVNLPVLGRQLNRNGEKLHFLKRYNSRTDDRRELKGYIH